MNFFGMFTISPEERLESALDSIFKDKEYKYLYFDFNNSLKIYIGDKVAVEIVYRTYTADIYTEVNSRFEKDLFNEYEVDYISKHVHQFLREKTKGN